MKNLICCIVTIMFLSISILTAHAQSRNDERHQPNIEIKMLADVEMNDTWFKAAKIGTGKDFSIASEYFISDQFIADHDLEVERLDEMDLVELYETLFSGVAPFKLIDAIAEKEVLELEMMDWEFVGTPQFQGEDCVMAGENSPPVWPKDIELPPCPEPDGRPAGRPLPPPPTGKPLPPDGKPLPDYYCWDDIKTWPGLVTLPFIPLYMSHAEYFCNYSHGGAILEDESNKIIYSHNILSGYIKLKALMKKKGNWVGKNNAYLGDDNDEDNGWYNFVEYAGGLKNSDIIFRITPMIEVTKYHWELRVGQGLHWTLDPTFPSVNCILTGVDDVVCPD